MAKKQYNLIVVPGDKNSHWLQLPADATARFRRMQGCQVNLVLSPGEFTRAFEVHATEGNFIGPSGVVSYLLTRLQQVGAVYKQNNQFAVCQSCGLPGREELPCSSCGNKVIYTTREGYYFRVQQYREDILQFIGRGDSVLPAWHRDQVATSLSTLATADVLIAQKSSRLQQEIYPSDWFGSLAAVMATLGLPGDEGGLLRLMAGAFIYCPWERLADIYLWCGVFAALDLPWPGGFICHGYYRLLDRQDKEVSLHLLAQNYGKERIRYMLLAAKGQQRDNVFSEDQAIQRINHDLTNGLSNLVSRVITLVSQHAGDLVPPPNILTRENSDLELRETALAGPTKMDRCVSAQDMAATINVVKDIIKAAESFATAADLSRLAADSAREERLHTVIYNLCEALRFIAILLKPLMPEAAANILSQLGLEEKSDLGTLRSLEQWGMLPVGTKIASQPQLFPPITTNYGHVGSRRDLVLREELARIKMVAARILSAEAVAQYEGAQRLILFDGNRRYSVLVSVGFGGNIGSLEGKKVVLLANVKPREIEGVIDDGEVLLLKSEAGDMDLVFLADDVPEGSRILCLS